MPLHAVGAVVVALLFGATAAPAQEPSPPPPARTPAAASHPVTSPGNAVWAQSVVDARSRASAEEKLVYYEFGSEHCGNCARMKALLYPAFDFEALLIGMVPVLVDFDSEEGKELGARYGITEVPSVLITNPEGRLVFLMQGFKDAPEFYGHVHSDLDAYRKFAREIDAQDVATLPAVEAYASGRDLFARLDYAGAARRLRRAAAAPDATPELRLSALEGLAAAELQLGNLAASRQAIDKVLSTTRSPEQRERAELFKAQIVLSEGNPEEALKMYKKFVKEHPGSPSAEKVRSFIDRLETATKAQHP